MPVKKNPACAVLLMLLVLLTLLPALRIPAAEGEPRETKTLNGSFFSFDKSHSWSYEFSDDYFFLPSDEYSHPFARASLGLALSAFRHKNPGGEYREDQDDYLVAFLQDAGFEEIDTHTYDSEPTTDSIALGIGQKKVDDVTVTVLAVCGENYGPEWASNLTVGDNLRSDGFADAARKVEDELDAYLKKHPVQGDSKMWITGYSRGGAVANIVAADCTDSGRFQDIYAYTFAAPRTTREPGNYPNIFNIIRKNDPVPKIPAADWGYQRYGVDMLLSSPDTDADSNEIMARTAENYQKLYGSEMVVNPEFDYHLRVLFDYLLYLLPDSAAYTRLLQPLLIDLVAGSERTDSSLEVLQSALQNFTAESKEQEAELTELQDYLETLINYHVLQGTTNDLPPHLWDQTLGLQNFFVEHFAFRYLSAMYASDDPEELFSRNTAFIRLVIYGDADAEIYDGDMLIRAVSPDETEDAAGAKIYAVTYPRVVCSGKKTAISLSADRSYTVKVKSRSPIPQILAYSGNLYSGDTFRAKTDPAYLCAMRHGGTVRIVTSTDGKVIDPAKSDHILVSNTLGRSYSPTVAIAIEENKIPHLTVNGVLTFLMYMLLFLLVQAIASIYISFRRKKKETERNTAVTTVWHAVNVFLFTFCELSMWYFVPTIPLLKGIFMILVLLVLLVYAWKLYRKINRPEAFRKFLIYAAALAVFGLLNACFAGKISAVKAVILVLIYIAFLLAAFLLFRKRRSEDEARS